MTTVLDKIVAHKLHEIEAAKQARDMHTLQAMARDRDPPRDFFEAVTQPGAVRLIAEVKKASPSKGVIRADFDPVAIAQAYARGGASAISVLTDAKFFQGSLDYLDSIRSAVALPLLRKDFILDKYQLWEARAFGADAVLLIAECLDNCQLRGLHDASLELGMTPLVELYEPENLERVLDAGALLVGVNNRDLRTFEVDLGHATRLRAQIPADRALVAESGIGSHDDVRKLHAHGVQAMLVGEHLMRQVDVEAGVRRLLGRDAASA